MLLKKFSSYLDFDTIRLVNHVHHKIYMFLVSIFAGGQTVLTFVGTINAEQAVKITESIKSLVKDKLCVSGQVTIESVNYKRNTG